MPRQVKESAVIGSDTIVVSSDKILQKPVSIDDARGMLRALSGQTHNVMTAVAIMVDGNLETRLSNTRVDLRGEYSDLVPQDRFYGRSGLKLRFHPSCKNSSTGYFVEKMDGNFL